MSADIFKRPGQFDSQHRVVRPNEATHRTLRCELCGSECEIVTVMNVVGSVKAIMGKCPRHGIRRRAQWTVTT